MKNSKLRQIGVVASKYCFLGILLFFGNATATASELGAKASQCDAIRAATYEETVVAKMDCYNHEMSMIRRDKLDLDELGAVIVSIRGKIREGTEKEYNCRSYVLLSEVKKVRPLVYGGICSDFWNESIIQLNEYYRLSCHVHYGGGDNKEASERAEVKYDECFTKNIPNNIRNDYSIHSRKEYVEKYNFFKKQYDKNRSAFEYEDLLLSCGELLREVQKKDPKLILARNLRCN